MVAPGLRWLYSHVPSYSEWNRFWIFWKMGDGVLQGVRVDPEWEPKDTAVSVMNDFMRMMLTEYLKAQFAARPDLLEQVVPTYPPGAKRLARAFKKAPGSATCSMTSSDVTRSNCPSSACTSPAR